MSHHLRSLDRGAIETVMSGASPIGLLFCHDASAQCYLMAQAVTEVASAFPGEIAFAHVEPRKNAWAMDRWQVRELPTLLVFHQGAVVARLEGMTSRREVLTRLARLVATLHREVPAP